MATRNEQFFIDLGKGASWAAGVAFQRSNPLPLDKYSVFETEAKAIEYATTSAVAYPGQVIAYVDNGKMAVCVLAQTADGASLELQPIGGAIGDYETAATDTLPQKKAIYDEAGENVIGYEVKWMPISAIVQGDGNTTYTFELKENDEKTIVITPYDKGEAGQTIEISLGFLTETEINAIIDPIKAEIGDPVNGETAATGLYKLIEDLEKALDARLDTLESKEDKDTTYSVKEGEKILSLDGTAFETTLKIIHEDNKIKLLGINDEEISSFDASEFVADGVLEDVSYNDETKDLTFTWNIEIGKNEETGEITYKTNVINIADLIDTYTAGKGLQFKDGTTNEFEIKLHNDNENEYLTVDENGLKLTGIEDIDTQLETLKEQLGDLSGNNPPEEGTVAATLHSFSEEISQNAQDIFGINEWITGNNVEGQSVDERINAKANSTDVYTKSEVYTQSETDNKIDEKIASVTGGESAADVKLALESYRDALNKEVWGDEAGSWTTTTTEDGKTVVTYTPAYGTESRIDKTEAKADTAIQDVQKASATETKLAFTNENNIIKVDDSALVQLIAAADEKATSAGSAAGTNTEAIGTLQTTVVSHSSRISDLETYKNSHETEFNALKGTVEGHSTALADKAAKADLTALQSTVGALESTVGGHTSSIAALQTSLENVYTKTEADDLLKNKADSTQVYTKNEIGTIETGKTLVDMITAAADTSALEARVKANEDAIKAIDFVDDEELAAAIKIETDRADTEEKRLAGLIAGNTATINSILGNKDEIDLNSIAELAAWITEHGTEAEGMTTAIEKNATDIAALTTTVTNNKTATDNAIKAITDNYLVKTVDDVTLQIDSDGKASVKAISTDLLVQGTEELIFKAGDAGTKAAE